ncbi:hypothetical protein ACFQ4N_05195 [Oceanobacillus iheyensis]|uniref:hypothetical protein n=1 Tax=Oceanobacillus iheyensis TaxID=182710 RepID=UPI003641A899
MKFLRDIDADSLLPYILTSSLLLLVSAFGIPGIAIIFIQDLLFFSYDHWIFIRPVESFKGFGIAMIWIAVTLLSFLLTKFYMEKKDKEYKLTTIHLLLLVVTIPLFIFSVSHYAYFDSNGVHGNDFWSLSEDNIAWDDVEEVSRVVDPRSRTVFSYHFSDSNTTIDIPYDTQDNRIKQIITEVINTNDWDVKDIYNE